MVKSGSKRSQEVKAANFTAATSLKEEDGVLARLGRHTIHFKFCSMTLTGVKDCDPKDSYCSRRYNQTNPPFTLNETIGLSIQQNPKKQVMTKRKKKETTAAMVTLYTGFPEERIDPESYYPAYPRKAIFF